MYKIFLFVQTLDLDLFLGNTIQFQRLSKKKKKNPKSGTDYIGCHQQLCGVFNNNNFN
jgi:hypothetical protein